MKEILEKCLFWTDEQKRQIKELLEKGWIDIVQAYSEYCKRRNLAEYIGKTGRSQIYKEGVAGGMTNEQREKWTY